jgi:hypothetical protein
MVVLIWRSRGIYHGLHAVSYAITIQVDERVKGAVVFASYKLV